MTQDNDHKPQDTDATINAGTESPDIEAQMEEAAEIQDEIDEEGHSAEQHIAHLEAEVERLKTEYLRALAEAQNVKRMADKKVEDNTKYALTSFAKEVLPVADNLKRALVAATPEAREGSEVLNTLAVGVEMTEKELQAALAKHGVARVDALNQPFDPNLHQAMTEMEDTSVPAGTVVQVFQDGYTIAGRLLRPAMVIISRGGPKADAAPAEPVDRQV